MALTDNLISYWKLDESSAGVSAVTRNDSHSTNHLTDNNTVASASDGTFGTVASFVRANSEYLSSTASALRAGVSGSLEISALLRFTSVSALQRPWGRIGSTSDREFMLSLDPANGQLAWLLADAPSSWGITLYASTFGALSTGVWYHVNAWYDAAADVAGISVNDVANTISFTAGIRTSSGSFQVGATTGAGGNYFGGNMARLALWQRALTSTERTQLYNSGAGLAYPFSSFVPRRRNRNLLLNSL